MFYVIMFLWAALCFYFSIKFDLSFNRYSAPLLFATTPCMFLSIYFSEAILLMNPRILYIAIIGDVVYIITLLVVIKKIKLLSKLPNSKKNFYNKERWLNFPGFVFIAYLI